MNVVLTNLERHENESRIFNVTVAFGDSTPVRYQASYDNPDPRARVCNVETDLFMALSNLAHQKFGKCTIYQIELMSIIGAFASDELDLELPAQLGTTKYCWSKPTRFKILYNKLRNWLTMIKWRLGVGRPNFNAAADNEIAG